ncbi:MAG: hypothetical protein GYA50_01020 [Eubacteriaceae bacterium]|nr:hypothetical protein [Eubacteriaceae bacterium]
MDSILNSINDIVSILEKLTRHKLFDYFAYIIIPALAITLPIIFINRNTNKQIANQNKETYRPRLKFIDFKSKKYDERLYNFVCISSKFDYNKCSILPEKNIHKVFGDIILKNIGNGLAHDITFYTLHNSKKCERSMSIDKNYSQFSFSTEEIEKDGVCKFNFVIIYNNQEVNMFKEDICFLLCNYKDLNNNNYKLIIGIVLKNMIPIMEDEIIIDYTPIYNTFYYQESTYEFNYMIGENKKKMQRY